MSNVFVNVGVSLDGFIAPEGMDMAHFDDPGYKGWMSYWMELQNWLFKTAFILENLRLGSGGETGKDNELWLTDAIDRLSNEGRVLVCEVQGQWYTTGDPLRFLIASVEYALRHPEFGKPFAEYLKTLAART